MAISSSMSTISKRLTSTILSNKKLPLCHTQHFFTSLFSTEPSTPPPDDSPAIGLDNESTESVFDNSLNNSSTQRSYSQSPVLEEGLDIGIYKAILVGQVGQTPLQKKLKNGRTVTLTTVGTGGIRNERIPFPNEEPREYADRCNVQWHRVVIYPEVLGNLVAKHAQPGSILYLEGNLETKVFTDQVTGIVKRIREIAVRRNGRIVFVGNGSDFVQPSTDQLKGLGYF